MVISALLALALQPDPAMLLRLFEEALARREKEYGTADPRVFRAASDLGLFLREQHETGAARRALSEALRVAEAALGPDSPDTLATAADLASVSPPPEAEALWRRAAESADASLAARALASLGDLRDAAGDRAGAANFFRRALSKSQAAYGPDSAQVAVRLNALALAVEPDEGVTLLRRALAINRRVWGERHPETATCETNLSGLLLAAGHVSEAVRLAAAALRAFEATLGPGHPRTAAAASNLADALRGAGNRPAAERLYRRALAIDERAYGPDHPETRTDVRNLAGFLRETGKIAEAARLERRLNAAPR